MTFLGDDYLISNAAGKRIFSRLEKLPVLDPHNHADVGEIAANKNYPDIWQLFAGTDHYVWSVERKLGVPEEFITGKRPNYEKFMRLAAVFPLLAGNPVYEWIHLDLRRYLGIDLLLGPDTGDEIWRAGNAQLAKPEFRPVQLLTGALNVEVICSTDDPVDLLAEHDAVNAGVGRMLVRPTWRPDKAMNLTMPGWLGYIGKLEQRFGCRIRGFGDLLAALKRSHDYFADHGCVASDHGVECPPVEAGDAAEADAAFRKMLAGEIPDRRAVAAYQSQFLLEVAALDAGKNWVFQLHSGAVRNVRNTIFRQLGPDAGGDITDPCQNLLPGLLRLLNRFDGHLKTALYCLDPVQQHTLAVTARAFGDKVRLGSAWWFNDNPVGMKRQLETIGVLDLFSTFAGMVSDSRKLLSYGSRFEMFRRVLADVLGDLAETGRAPEAVLADLAVKMSYDEPKRFYGL